MLNLISNKQRYVMNDEERAKRKNVKAMHVALRAPLRRGGADRHELLAWAFARGLPRRRCERQNHIQTINGRPTDAFGHLVASRDLAYEHILAVAGWVDAHPLVVAWLRDPSGAIPAPAARLKEPRAETAAAE